MKTTTLPSSRFLGLLAALALPMALTGCSGGSSSGGSSTGSGANTMTAQMLQMRMAVAKAISDQYNAQPHISAAADNQALLRFLQGRAEFEATGQVDPFSVWARYKDTGELLVIANDGSLNNNDLNTDPPRSVSPNIVRTRDATELPAGQNFVVVDNIGAFALTGDDFTKDLQNFRLAAQAYPHTKNIAQMLTDAGYKPSWIFGTPFNLQTAVQNADGLYILGHGGFGIDRIKSQVFVLGTTQPVFTDFNFLTLGTADLDVSNRLQPEIKAGRVTSMMYVDATTGAFAPPGTHNTGTKYKRVLRAYYAITPAFVQKYMSFKPLRSFVFVNGCNGADLRNGLAQGFINAFTATHAAVYGSWDRHADGPEALDTATVLFSGLLGTASNPPKLSPPQRPFDYKTLLAYLTDLPRPAPLPPLITAPGYSYDLSLGEEGTATLQIAETQRSNQPQFGLLAPSLSYLVVDSPTNTLNINGQFGNDLNNVTVTLAGKSLPIQDKSSALITCSLPSVTAGGPVVVTINGHTSNSVDLMSWYVTFHFKDQNGGAFFTADFSVHFLGDVHGARSQPYQNIDTSSPLSSGLHGALGIGPDSRLTAVNAGGAYLQNVGPPIPWNLTSPFTGPRSILEDSPYGSGNLPPNIVFQDNFPTPNVYRDEKGNITLQFVDLQILGKGAVTQDIQGTSPSPLDIDYAISGFTIPMDRTFHIPSGSFSGGKSQIANSPEFEQQSWSWDAASPTPAYNPNATRALISSHPGDRNRSHR